MLEALAAGLPVIYHSNGGSINNYCSKYGCEYSDSNELLEQIKNVKKNYDNYKDMAMRYTRSIDDVVGQYERIIYGL